MGSIPVESWEWPEYTLADAELDPENVTVKKDIAAKYGEDALRRSWKDVCERLQLTTQKIKEQGTALIREYSYDDFLELDDTEKNMIKERGCVVVRGTIPQETAIEWFQDMKTYTKANQGIITGWPEEAPYILQLYWSRAQLGSRTHPRAMKVQRALLDLFHDDEDKEKKFASPLAYADAMRMRPPGKRFHGLGPHIDAGSLCRWDDPEYRQTYDKVWSGDIDAFDPFDLTHRKRGDPSYHPGAAQSHVVRGFQGWTALSAAAPREGSLQLFPDLKLCIAYVLLRPFFDPPENPADIMDHNKWTFNLDNPWFPGVWRHTPQVLSPDAFPHLRLKECLPYIPKVNPGDTVWWHLDMCHAVEIEHNGTDFSTVTYGNATPTTEMNVRYMKNQLQDLLDGVSPEDFRGGCVERHLKGFPGTDAILNGEEGRRAVGFGI